MLRIRIGRNSLRAISIVGFIALLFAVVPDSSMGQQGPAAAPSPASITVSVPAGATNYISEPELVQIIYEMTLWRSGEMVARLEAVDEALTPLAQALNDVSGVTVKLPDTKPILMQIRATIDQVGKEATIAGAQRQLNKLGELAGQVASLYSGLQIDAAPLQGSLATRASALQEKITTAMAAEAARLQAEFQARLTAKANRSAGGLQASMAAEIQAYTASLAANIRGPDDAAAMPGKVASYANQLASTLTARLQADIDAEARVVEQEGKARLEARLKELLGTEGKALQDLQKLGGDVGARIDQLTREKMVKYEAYRAQALKHLREMVNRITDGEFKRAEDLIRKEVPSQVPAGSSIPDTQALLAKVKAEREQLLKLVDAADSQEAILDAVSDLQARWANIQKDLERVKLQGVLEAMTQIKARLDSTNAAGQISEGLRKTRDGIRVLESLKSKNQLDARRAETLKKLYVLRSELQGAADLITQFGLEYGKKPPTITIEGLLELKDRLQSKLESIDRAVKEGNLLPSAVGIFLEAENELRADLASNCGSYCSKKETSAAWRPQPLSGNGDWVLHTGGDDLIYRFNVPAPGKVYSLWIRDFEDGKHQSDARTVSVYLVARQRDTLGEFSSQTLQLGKFRWHKVATVLLSENQYEMHVTKARTTSASALLDAFYWTSDPNEVPPEKP